MEIHYCQDIDSFPIDKYFQKGQGDGKYILIVGESPAENGWKKSGKACYSPKGKLLATGRRLNELLNEHGLNVEMCGFTELAKCYVGKNRKVLSNCCRKCWPIFIKQIERENFKLIVTLGVITMNMLGELIGKKLEMGQINKIIVASKERWVIPIYHPSPINPKGRERNRKIWENNKEDIRKLIEE